MDYGGSMAVAALGRPFSLGMLYDCRRDLLVPGMTLWDRDDLKKHIGERPQNSNEFEIVTSESIEDKSSALKVEASLKASFLGGMIEVEGSAKYLNDHKTSRNQARVTLKYETTTKFEELSMNHLASGKMKHEYVFEKGIATHVVTGILYGARAFFVFDREISEREDHQVIQGNLKVMIKKIPSISIDGKGSLNMEDKDKEHVEKFSCKFHGDFSLEENPVSFQDAIQVYQKLPKLLGPDGGKAVPVKVWLLPLTSLDSSAAKLVRQISIGLVQEAQTVLEDFSELEMRCNDAMRTATAQQFPQIGKKLKSFKEMCSVFKLEFQRTLSMKLPSIRGGGEEEAVLAEILEKRHSSPFNSKNLTEWMDFKEREISILNTFTKMMKNTETISSLNGLHEKILSAEQVLCFVFTSLGNAESYLSALSKHLKGTTTPDDPQDAHTYDVEKEQWYLSVHDEMRKKAKLFSNFAEANEDNMNIKFLIAGLTNETQKGTSIYLYEEGSFLSENFEPPSQPESVKASDINHNSVTLKISPPRFGAENITSYSVEYCVRGEEGWQQKTVSKDGDVTASDLSPNTEYVFRCRAVTSVGVGPVNEVSGNIRTLPCSPPGKPRVEPNSSEITVSWQGPAELGQDVQVLSYIVEYIQADKVGNGEDLQWNKLMSEAEKVIISELQSETEYVVRVRCDCGGAGTSKESISVNVCTKDVKPLTVNLQSNDCIPETAKRSQRLADAVRDESTLLEPQSGSIPVYKIPLQEEDFTVNKCKRFRFGKESDEPNRTIMVLGATGAGKSTLINRMINYVLGVEWNDPYRFKLVDEGQSNSQAHSQTTEVTTYKLNHRDGFKIQNSLTIVDTPGFGDTGGIEKDKLIVEQLRDLFSAEFGISEIDAVCFVVQASARLTSTQKYVFDSVLSIFGKDVGENIQILVTFADVCQRPPVLEAINNADVPCPKTKEGLPIHFKFNNSALFAQNKSCAAEGASGEDDEGDFDEMFWNMGIKSMRKFFTALNVMTTKSLSMTKDVLRERQQLEISVQSLHKQVKIRLNKLEEELKETASQLEDHKAEISRNQWEYKEVTKRITLKEMKEKSLIATKKAVKALIDRLKTEYEDVKTETEEVMGGSTKCLNRLKEIALRPNPLSTPEYIDMLIEGEEAEAKSGWKKRVQHLIDMREQAEVMAKVDRD